MRRSIRTSYTHTILASYLGYITQAVVNNFAPLLFLTFRSQMGLTLEQITLLTTLNFSIQLLVDFLSVKVVDRIGYRPCVVAAHLFSAAGLSALAFLPQLLGKTFTYSTDTEQFDLISTPLSSLQRMMDAAVAGIAVTGAVLAALLLLLWTRGRKREVGIFLALGKGKGEILLQFFVENLLLALPAGAAALGLAALLGERAGDILAAANGVEGLDVAVRFQDAAAVYGLGALLLALAVLLAAATVLRCKPKDILSQME